MSKPILLLFITLLNLIPMKVWAEPIFMKNLGKKRKGKLHFCIKKQ